MSENSTFCRPEETLLSVGLLGARIGTTLARCSELRECLDECARLLVLTLDARFVLIWLPNTRTNILELFVIASQNSSSVAIGKIPIGDLDISVISQKRKPHRTSLALEDPVVKNLEWAKREELQAFAGYPLIAGDKLEGVLALFSRHAISEPVDLCLLSICEAISLTIEHSRRDRQLKAAHVHSSQVLDAITDAFFALDTEWRFTYANRRFEEVMGRNADSLIERVFWQEFPETLGTAYEQNYREAVRTGKAVIFEAYYPPLKLWTEVHTYPFAQGLSIYFQDISERKILEQRLRDAAKLESLGVMAGGIAHDFNNLLTGILGNASMLMELTDPAERQIAEDIVKAAQRAGDLTRQMLAFSGKGRFEVRPVDLSLQVREILRLVKPMIDRQVEIELSLGENLPCVEADPGQMQQLIMNLVINGAEAMDGAPGRVTIRTRAFKVDQSFLSHIVASHEISPGPYVCLEIQDTGCGMSDETKAKIFDPFFTTKFTGRGLGLAAVAGIIRGHKGALRINSSLGEGTTFTVFLPAAENRENVSPPAEPMADHGRGIILFVDDEEIVRRIGSTCLERQGYQVLLAGNGKEAIALFEVRGSEIRLVILDMTMPVMSGAETLLNLRKLRPDIPVIVSSGYNEVEVIRRFTSQGIAGFLQKPYTAATLTGKVWEILQTAM